MRVAAIVLVFALACQAGVARGQPRPARTAPSGIVHRPVDTVLAGRALILRARVGEDLLELARLRLYYRHRGSGRFFRKPMIADHRGGFQGCIPGQQVAATRLQYFLEGLDARGRPVAAVGSRGRPLEVRLALAPPSIANAPPQGCADGAGRPEGLDRPSPAQLRQVALRRSALAQEARGMRLRRVGRGLVVGGLIALAVGAGLVGYGLSQGPVFIWMGVGIAGVAALVALVGTPLWVTGTRQIREALRRLRRPGAGASTLPEVEWRRIAGLGGGPSRAAGFGWRLQF